MAADWPGDHQHVLHDLGRSGLPVPLRHCLLLLHAERGLCKCLIDCAGLTNVKA